MRYSASHLQQLAQGHWVQILSAAGLDAVRMDGRGHPCPKCGGRDRFASFPNVADRGAVHCRQCFTRGTNPSPGDGIASLMWLLNSDFASVVAWLADHLGLAPHSGSGISHSIASPAPTRSPQRSSKQAPSAALVQKMTAFARDAMIRIQTQHFDQLRRELSLPTTCLRSLCVGYSTDHRATTWPMRSSDGSVTGIRLRSIDGPTKWSVRESIAGLFLSRNHKPVGDQLIIVEGATDMAAAIDLGLIAIGRPSCCGSTHIVIDYIQRHGFQNAIVIADNDSAGIAGANALAIDLARSGTSARVITPPADFEDLRSWHRAGIQGAGIHPNDILNRVPVKEHAGSPVTKQLSFSFTGSDLPAQSYR